MASETTYGQWALTTNKNQGSRLSNLTSGTAAGKIKYVSNGIKSASEIVANGASTTLSGIVFPLLHGDLAGAPFNDADKKNQIGDPNELSYSLTTGDFFANGVTLSVSTITEDSGTATATTSTSHPLTTGDTVTISGADQSAYNASFVVTVTGSTTFTFSVASGTGTASGTIVMSTSTVEKDGGAQKVINAILDTAYVAYNSGVQLGSGLNSMTVSRGNLSLTSSAVTGISGVVNTYSRGYSVTFNYKQSGMLIDTNTETSALPDITNDLVGEAGDGPF